MVRRRQGLLSVLSKHPTTGNINLQILFQVILKLRKKGHLPTPEHPKIPLAKTTATLSPSIFWPLPRDSSRRKQSRCLFCRWHILLPSGNDCQIATEMAMFNRQIIYKWVMFHGNLLSTNFDWFVGCSITCNFHLCVISTYVWIFGWTPPNFRDIRISWDI